jgi:DNA-binding GntR family transcriptional regulator
MDTQGADERAGDGREAAGGADALIQQSLLGKQVYELLWRRIVSHQLRPGDKLSDLRLSGELGVSRTPVREALHRLAQEGMVRAESRRGFYVSQFSSDDVREVYDVRTALEVLAVRLALPNLSAAQIAAAQEDLDAVGRRVRAGDPTANEAFLLIDRAFHEMLVQAANNRRLAGLMAGLQAQLRVFQFYGIHFQDMMEMSLEHHQAILAALRAGDHPAAEAAMERHIQQVKERVLADFPNLEAPDPAGAGSDPLPKETL